MPNALVDVVSNHLAGVGVKNVYAVKSVVTSTGGHLGVAAGNTEITTANHGDGVCKGISRKYSGNDRIMRIPDVNQIGPEPLARVRISVKNVAGLIGGMRRLTDPVRGLRSASSLNWVIDMGLSPALHSEPRWTTAFR